MRWLKDDRGLSLTELLVVCALLGIVITAVYMLVGAASAMTDASSARAIASDEAQRAVERMSIDIREAQENQMLYGVAKVAQPNELQIFVNATGNGRPQLVRYWANGGSLWRTVQLASDTTTPDVSTTGWSFGTASTPERIVKTLDTTHGDIFCYHGRVSSATQVCPNNQKHGFLVVPAGVISTPLNNKADDPAGTWPKISMIGINLVNSNTQSGRTATVVTDVLVRVRSIDNDTN